jgi:hypothetical protein
MSSRERNDVAAPLHLGADARKLCRLRLQVAKTARKACAGSPTGRWTGDFESYPLDNPNFVRSGALDLVVAEGGKIQGHTVEEDGLDRGSLTGTAKPGGEFEADYAITRNGQPKTYQVKGSYVCEADGMSGMGTVTFDGKRGNLKFKVRPAP